MLKILWKREEIAPEEQFLLLSTIFYYLMLDFCVKTRIRFSLRDKRLFEITEVEITRVDCILLLEVVKGLDICYKTLDSPLPLVISIQLLSPLNEILWYCQQFHSLLHIR